MSRSLAACEGALLVVDASQGVEAQTVANVYLALEGDLTVVPVLNKIDLPGADPEGAKKEIEEVLSLDCSGAILASAKVSVTLRHFFKVVAEAGRLNLLPELRRTFADLVDERDGIVEAKVASAQPLTEDQSKALVVSLAARTGKTIRLTWSQDTALLGGIKVQVGSTVLDASLQGQLRQLKTQLLSA